MRKIQFKSIEMSYFLSTGKSVKYNFDDGIFFITGENRTTGQENQNNGVGKTNIFFDSIIFAAYGETSRNKFPKSAIPFNGGGRKKCLVEFEFDILENDFKQNVLIRRSINPSKLELIVDGEDLSQSNAASTQNYIIETFFKGIKKDVFMQSMATRADTTSFFSMNKVEREKFIGTIFDLAYIKEAEKLARLDYNELGKDLGKKDSEISAISPQLDMIKTQIKTTKEEVENEKNRRKERIDQLEREITEFKSSIGEAPKELNFEEETEKCRKTITKISDKISENRNDYDKLKSEYNDIKRRITNNISEIERKRKSKVCSECGRDIEKQERDILEKDCKKMENDNESLNKKLPPLKERAEELKEEILNLTDKKSKIEDAKNKITKRVVENQNLINQYNNKLSRLESMKNNLNQIKEDSNQPVNNLILRKLIEDFKNTKNKLKKCEVDFSEMEERLKVLEHVKIVFSDKGLRSSILSKLIALINSSLNNYLNRFRTPCSIEFDEHMDYVIKNIKGVEMPYEAFSGGEKWRINMSLFLTFSDILRIQNQITFSVKLIDEFFDLAIDQEGLGVISEILVERREDYGENPYIITHKTGFDIPDSYIINVVKEKGISRIES